MRGINKHKRMTLWERWFIRWILSWVSPSTRLAAVSTREISTRSSWIGGLRSFRSPSAFPYVVRLTCEDSRCLLRLKSLALATKRLKFSFRLIIRSQIKRSMTKPMSTVGKSWFKRLLSSLIRRKSVLGQKWKHLIWSLKMRASIWASTASTLLKSPFRLNFHLNSQRKSVETPCLKFRSPKMV